VKANVATELSSPASAEHEWLILFLCQLNRYLGNVTTNFTDSPVTIVNQLTRESLTARANYGGVVFFGNVSEGQYAVNAQAIRHAPQNRVVLVSGRTQRKSIFLPYSVVSYTWTVTPTVLVEVYTFTLQVSFVTHVPKPVVIVTPASLDTDAILRTRPTVLQFTIENRGFINAENLTIQLPQIPGVTMVSLVDLPDILAPDTTLIVPVRLSYTTGTRHRRSSGGCGGNVGHTFPCGGQDRSGSSAISAGCGGTAGGSGGSSVPWGGSGGGGSSTGGTYTGGGGFAVIQPVGGGCGDDDDDTGDDDGDDNGDDDGSGDDGAPPPPPPTPDILDDICDALSKAANCLSAAASVSGSQRGSCAASAAKAACAANGGGNPSATQQAGGTAVETGSAASACLGIKNPKAACGLASAGYALCMDRAFRDDDAIMRALMATQCGTSWIMGCTGPVGAVSQPSHLPLHLPS
jgi:hypothetical protein